MSHNNCTRPDGNKGCIDCVAYGAAEEQERIIKLLGATFKSDGAYLVTAEDDKPANLSEVIALIKGEK